MKAAEAPPEDTMTQRQRAMANLAKGGVKDAKGGGVKTGGKPGGQIEALKAAAGVTDEGPQKGMVPNWKQTDGQRKAHQEKMAARAAGGDSQMANALKSFGGQIQRDVSTSKGLAVPAKPPSSFVPKTTPTKPVKPTAPPATEAPQPVREQRRGSVGTKDAEESVEHELTVLLTGIVRLGTSRSDGSYLVTFGVLVDDERLEQLLESLVGSLKAGRKRGVLQWEGQLLLKGPHDAAEIVLVAGEAAKAAEARAAAEAKEEAAGAPSPQGPASAPSSSPRKSKSRRSSKKGMNEVMVDPSGNATEPVARRPSLMKRLSSSLFGSSKGGGSAKQLPVDVTDSAKAEEEPKTPPSSGRRPSAATPSSVNRQSSSGGSAREKSPPISRAEEKAADTKLSARDAVEATAADAEAIAANHAAKKTEEDAAASGAAAKAAEEAAVAAKAAKAVIEASEAAANSKAKAEAKAGAAADLSAEAVMAEAQVEEAAAKVKAAEEAEKNLIGRWFGGEADKLSVEEVKAAAEAAKQVAANAKVAAEEAKAAAEAAEALASSHATSLEKVTTAAMKVIDEKALVCSLPKGVKLGLALHVDGDGRTIVTRVVEGGAAESAGMKIGMMLVRVDGVGILSKELPEVLGLVQNPPEEVETRRFSLITVPEGPVDIA